MIISSSILFRMNKKGQCTNSATLRCIRATTVAVEKQYVLQIVRVFVALGTQREMRMGYIVICGLSGSTTFFHLINGTIFERKKKKL